MIRIVWDGKLHRKTTAYCLRTKVISKLTLFIELRLQLDHFFKDSFFRFAEFWIFRTYIVHVVWNCECWCLLNKSSLSSHSAHLWAEWSRRFGRLSALTSKRRHFILAYNSRPKFGECSALVCINYVTKFSLNEKGISVCRNRKQFQIHFGESVWSIYHHHYHHHHSLLIKLTYRSRTQVKRIASLCVRVKIQ